jgi:hypothetical protein
MMLWDRTCRLGQVRRRRATRGAGKYRAPGSRAPAAPVLAVRSPHSLTWLSESVFHSLPGPTPTAGTAAAEGQFRGRDRVNARAASHWLAGLHRISVPCHRSTSFIPIILLSTLITCEAPSVFFSFGQRKFCSTCLLSQTSK